MVHPSELHTGLAPIAHALSVPRTSVADVSLVQSSSSLRPPLSLTLCSFSLSFYLSLPLSHVLAALFLSLSVTPFPLPRRSIVRSPPHPHHFSRSPTLSLSLSLCPIYLTSGSLFLTYSLTCSLSHASTRTRVHYTTYTRSVLPLICVCGRLLCVVYLPRV